MTDWPRVLAHRGASGYRQENTLPAFREAIARGCDGIELDLHTTGSGDLVVIHDPVLPSLGSIAELSLAAVRAISLPDGSRIPTLGEALETIAKAAARENRQQPVEVWVEIKGLPQSADPALLDQLSRAGSLIAAAVHSFDHRIVARLGKRMPELRRGILSASYPLDPVGQLKDAGSSALWQEWHLIDAEMVKQVHRAGGEVIAWTVNDSAAATELARLGVDALCGNWPDQLKAG